MDLPMSRHRIGCGRACFDSPSSTVKMEGKGWTSLGDARGALERDTRS
jgi:hypothetical protein